MSKNFDVKIRVGDFGRGFVMTVFDKDAGCYIGQEGWVESDLPIPFLTATGLMNKERFKDLMRSLHEAFDDWLEEDFKSKVAKKLQEAFADEVKQVRGEGDRETTAGPSDEGSQGRSGDD